MKFSETSHIIIEIDGNVVSRDHKDVNDAWMDAVNRLILSGSKAVMTVTITVEKVSA